MSHSQNAVQDELFRSIMAALDSCYGGLSEPSFSEVSATLRADPHREIQTSLQRKGIVVTDTTDLNNDVSTRLVLDRAGDQVGLALSGVGLFAAVLHQDSEGQYSWLLHPDHAPTSLAADTVRTVQKAGYKLLGRDVVSQSIAMNWYDGSTRATLYQALFTDSDRIP